MPYLDVLAQLRLRGHEVDWLVHLSSQVDGGTRRARGEDGLCYPDGAQPVLSRHQGLPLLVDRVHELPQLQHERLLSHPHGYGGPVLLVDARLLADEVDVDDRAGEDGRQRPYPAGGHPVRGEECGLPPRESHHDGCEVFVLRLHCAHPCEYRPRLLGEEPPRSVDVVDGCVLHYPDVGYVLPPPVLPVELQEDQVTHLPALDSLLQLCDRRVESLDEPHRERPTVALGDVDQLLRIRRGRGHRFFYKCMKTPRQRLGCYSEVRRSRGAYRNGVQAFLLGHLVD